MASKLVRFGARDYDAVSGRFLSADPLLVARVADNAFGYGRGDPVGNTDRDGLTSYPYISVGGTGKLVGIISGTGGIVGVYDPVRREICWYLVGSVGVGPGVEGLGFALLGQVGITPHLPNCDGSLSVDGFAAAGWGISGSGTLGGTVGVGVAAGAGAGVSVGPSGSILLYCQSIDSLNPGAPGFMKGDGK
jgi:hypothetical protein